MVPVKSLLGPSRHGEEERRCTYTAGDEHRLGDVAPWSLGENAEAASCRCSESVLLEARRWQVKVFTDARGD